MRTAVLPAIAWLGFLDALPGAPTETMARVIAMAAALGTLTVLIYRLGVWRQLMEHTRNDVAAQVRLYREESTRNFDRIERRLDAIEGFVGRSAAT